jgi:CTP synthase (UTP-ammonia lyase)
LVGDIDRQVIAHQAIDRSIGLAQSKRGWPIEACWVPTELIRPGDPTVFGDVNGIWLVPASPYRHTEGALWAVEYARTCRKPLLGTCGGFQHALLEYARNALGRPDADHAELNPGSRFPLLAVIECALVEARQAIRVTSGQHLRRAYGA